MPSLYGTGTTYTVTASNVISLYQVSSATTVITATTYSTNLVGLYGGSYAALPTNAEQLIQLFDNNGNVHFYLDPLTNSSTIYASFVGSATITLGNYLFNGDSISNVANDNINFETNGNNWYLNNDGSTSFPNYTFPAADGTSGQMLTTNGSGTLAWTTNTGGVTSILAGSGISVSTASGAVTVSNTGVTSITAGTGTFVSTASGNVTIWSSGSTFDISTVTNQKLFTTSSVTFGNLQVTNLTTITGQASLTRAVLTINSTGGTTYQPPHADGYEVWAIGEPNTSARIVTDAYVGTVSAAGSVWTGRKARGTAAAPTAAQDGDLLLRIAGTGYGTTEFESTSSGFLEIVAAENFTDSAHGTKINFVTTDVGSNDQSTPLVLKSDGIIITAPTSSNNEAALLVNQSSSTSYISAGIDGYLVWGINKPNTRGRFAIDTYIPEDANHDNASVFTGRRARGTVTAPTAVQLDDTITRLNGFGYTGSRFNSSSTGFVQIVANETHSNTANGGRIELGVMNRGSTNTTSVAVLDDSGFTADKLTSRSTVVATTELQAATLKLTGLSNVSTAYTLYYNPTTDLVTYGTAGSSNPFNQDLNTYDSPIFAGLTLNGALTGGTWTYAGSTINLNSNGAVLTASPDATHSGLLINESGSTSYPAPHVSGYNVWTINDPGTSARLVADTYGSGVVSSVTGRRALGTAASPSAVVAGSSLVRVTGIGYGTTGYGTTSSGYMDIVAVENFTDTANGTKITFNTAPVGSRTNDTVLTVKSDGSIITAPGQAATEAALLINPSNVSGYQSPGADGYAVWAINKTGQAARFVGDTYDGGDSTFFTGRRARGTAGSPTAAQNSDVLNRINGFGYGSTGFGSASSAFINFVANENFTDTAQGGRIEMGVAANGSVTNATKLSLNSTELTASVDIIPSGARNIGSPTYPWTNGYIANLNGVSNLTFSDSTTQTTAWTGAVSTGTVFQKVVSAGGLPLNSVGTATIFITGGTSPALVVSNHSGNLVPSAYFRGYGQNRPNGTATTQGNPGIWLEGSRGTNTAPTAVATSDSLGGLIVGGYNGENWMADNSNAFNFLGFFASEAWTSSGGVAQQSGSGFNIFTQPAWTRPGTNSTRQRFLITNWTTATGGPSINNIAIGSGVDNTAPTMTMVDGTTYTGYGRASITIPNSLVTMQGVPAQDAAPDNNTLLGTNIFTISSSRRSGISGRRNALQINDVVGSISFNATTATNSTVTGPSVGFINLQMLENATNTARGTLMQFNTVPTGSTTASLRLGLNAVGNSHNADFHTFKDRSGTFTAMTVSTGSVSITQGTPLNVGNSSRTVPTTTGISGTTPVLVGSFATSTYTAGKFVVTIKDGTNVHTAEVLLTSNGSGTSNTVYGTVTVGTGVLGTFSSSISGGNAQLIFTPTGATSMTVKASLTTI